MNKAELVEEVANQTGLTRKACREEVDAVISVITDSLTRGEKVTLVGFGTFQVMERKARRGRNPRADEAIDIPARKLAKFRPGRELRSVVKY